MYLVGLGLLFMALKYLEIGPIALWSWWWVLSPFVGAMVWWQWADSSGYTKRKSMEREQARKQARIEANREMIGTSRAKKRR